MVCPGAAAAQAKPAAPAASKPAASGQPPLPSMAAMKQAQQLTQQLGQQPQGGNRAGAAASARPGPGAGGQPPIPSMAAVRDVQAAAAGALGNSAAAPQSSAGNHPSATCFCICLEATPPPPRGGLSESHALPHRRSCVAGCFHWCF